MNAGDCWGPNPPAAARGDNTDGGDRCWLTVDSVCKSSGPPADQVLLSSVLWVTVTLSLVLHFVGPEPQETPIYPEKEIYASRSLV